MNESPNMHPTPKDETVPTDGWMPGPRLDILDSNFQMKQRYPGMDPAAMRTGPTEGHISVVSLRPEADRNIEPVSGSAEATPTTAK